MSIVQDLNRYKFECGGVPVEPMHLLVFDNISVTLQWSFDWGAFPEVRGRSHLREYISRRLLEEPEREKNPAGEQVEVYQEPPGQEERCSRAVKCISWGRLLQAVPTTEGHAGCLAHSSGLPGAGGQLSVSVRGSSAGQKGSAASSHPGCSWDPRSFWGIAVL